MSRAAVPTNRDRGLTLAVMLGLVLIPGLTGCVLFSSQQVTFEGQGIRVGLETDLSVSRPASPRPNSHPVVIAEQDLRRLLALLQVSGYSGTLLGLVVEPPRRPVFSQTELELLAAPLAAALAQAKPSERVFFSLKNPAAPYERDRTVGALFVRGPLLHVVLTDHYAYLRADTAGGEDYPDPRDHKGMRLYLARPAAPAHVAPDQEPAWDPLEPVHLSFNYREAMSALAALADQTESRTAPAATVRPAAPAADTTRQDEAQRLRRQIEELTDSNLDLRNRLKDQSEELERLKQEVERLRKDQPAPQKKGARKPPPPNN